MNAPKPLKRDLGAYQSPRTISVNNSKQHARNRSRRGCLCLKKTYDSFFVAFCGYGRCDDANAANSRSYGSAKRVCTWKRGKKIFLNFEQKASNSLFTVWRHALSNFNHSQK